MVGLHDYAQCNRTAVAAECACAQVAERLYISGYLSYPRTESSAYPPNFDIKGKTKGNMSETHACVISAHGTQRTTAFTG